MNYPLASTTWDERELNAMRAVMESGNFSMGAQVQQFEQEFAAYFGSKYAVMSNSGSSANLLAIAALKYRKSKPLSGGEIIVPTVSWGTTYYPVHQLGFTLKFVDIELDTLNASVVAIEAAISPRTVGVFAVNLLGNPSNLLEIRKLCDTHDLFLVEDNCESMGAEVSGRFAGTFGDIGTFSSFFSHHISTMEGGMCVTDDEELAQNMRSLRAHGWLRGLPDENFVFDKSGDDFEDSFKFVLPGYNLRPLELSGAIGVEQLKKLTDLISERRDNANFWVENMKNNPNYVIQREFGKSSWFGFSIILRGRNIGRRAELVKLLRGKNIECRPIVAGNFTSNPVMKHLNSAPIGPTPVADEIQTNGLFFGNHHFDLSNELNDLIVLLNDF